MNCRADRRVTYRLDSPEVQALCASDNDLSRIIELQGDISYTLCSDAFHFIIETIVGQMLSRSAAEAISERLARLCNDKLTVEAIMHLEYDEIKNVGLSDQKTTYIKRFAEYISRCPSFLEELEKVDNDDDIISQLTRQHGIGTWTAKMYLIFVLDRPDILPYEDGAFLQAYRKLYMTSDVHPSQIIERCRKWHPYASLASRYLYRALDGNIL